MLVSSNPVDDESGRGSLVVSTLIVLAPSPRTQSKHMRELKSNQAMSRCWGERYLDRSTMRLLSV